MAYASCPELLTLHALRVAGMADCRAVGRRFALADDVVEDLLLDAESRGWVRRVAFVDLRGWALTDRGRAQGERLLAEELHDSGARSAVCTAHRELLALNPRFLAAVTDWQLRREPLQPLVANDHTDHRWDDRVLGEVRGLGARLQEVDAMLNEVLERFAGYATRFWAALAEVQRGRRLWLDEPSVASCHTVWFQLHEDLLATLGLERGREG